MQVAAPPRLKLTRLLVLVCITGAAGACHDGPAGGDGSEYSTEPAALAAVVAAQEALDAGNVGLAIDRIERAAALDAESPAVLSTQGVVLTHADRLEEARFALEKLLERFPRHDDGWLKLGNVALRQQQYEDAITFYEKEIQLKPSTAAWYNLSLAHAEMDDPAAARDALTKATELDPEYANAYAALADLSEADGDFEAALRHARRAAELRPDDNRLQEKYGFMLLRMGRHDEAVAVLEPVVAREPWDYQARYNLGQALQRLGRTQEAQMQLQRAESDREGQSTLRRLERSIRMDPTNARLHFALGIEYQKWSRLEDAMRSYHVAKQMTPDNLLIDLNLATIYLHRDDLEEAKRRFESILEQDSSIAAAWLNLGFVDARKGDLAGARRAWEQALAIEPGYRTAVDAFQERYVASR